MLLAGMITSTGFMGGTITLQAAEPTSWIGDEGLNGTASEPESDAVVPDQNQFRYQKEELAAFCHFGPNTFNEIEWGEHYGNKKPSEIFTLKNDFDAETLVNTLKEAGFKKLIVTAKHHDGFCIWDSAHTEYDVKAAGYKDKNGNSDILAEISKACTDANMDMGLYLSPWDIHDPSYGYKDANGKPLVEEVTVNGKKENRPIDGHDWKWVYENDAKDYNQYYKNQLEEILSNPKYGNNGKFVEVWMDGAKGGGSNYQEYTFKEWFDTIQKYEGKGVEGRDADCLLFGADAYTTVRWIGNEHGLAAKDTWSKSTVDDKKTTINSNNIGGFTAGFENGNQWTVPEADARITSGWFWGTQKNTPKSMEELSNMYFNSVGHNATLLLNVPPNTQGTVDEPILKRIEEFGTNIKNTFAKNLAKEKGASVKVSSVRGNAQSFKPGNMVDDKDETYWTTNDGTNKGEILIDLGEKKNFDVVSIEEAIQKGQRINQYKVEYRDGTDGAWTLLEEGQTIGAKRLCRASEVSARQIKITVSTPDGKVPMISEIGVYKSTESMEKPNPIPKGMETIDVTDKDVSDGKGFTFNGKWNPENQPQYINGTNTWANAGAELELKFHGTKAYLLGTVDPGHGEVEITVDDGEKVVVDTKAQKRATGQRLFETKDLEDGDHTIKLKVVGKAAGIEAAAVINNGGKGMIQLEENSYTMNENEKRELKVKRVGGTEGKVTARLQPNPGTAIQGDFNTDLNPEIVFENGVSETTAAVETRRNPDKTGDRDFTVEITDVKGDVILGFNKKAKITIKDMESGGGVLASLIKECESYKQDWFVSGWEAFETALKNAQAIAKKDGATPEEMKKAETALTDAKKSLVKRDKYTSEDPFKFPWRKDSSATLEAEFFELHNTGNDEKWPLKVTDGDWASNKKFVNCLNGDDTITIPYKIEKPGKYKVVVTYRSGSDTNSLAWSDDAGNIKPGSTDAGNNNANETKTKEFEIVAEKAGSGILTLKGNTKDAPQLDKFEITPKDVKLEDVKVTASVDGKGGKISPEKVSVKEGENVEFTITPDLGYKVKDVLVNGTSVGSVTKYTLTNVKQDTNIVVLFELSIYTEEHRFDFPTEVNGTPVILEAEDLVLTNTGDANEKWKLGVKEKDWASNGKYVDSMNNGDKATLHYHADKPGKYKATIQFRSGDVNNGLTWAENSGKIKEGNAVVGAGDGAAATHTADIEFVVNEAGDGTLVFTAPEKNAPQLDKFDITLVEENVPTPEVNKEELQTVVKEAEGKLQEVDKYTEETVNVLKEAVSRAKDVLNDTKATQEQINEAVTGVRGAIGNLAEKPPVQKEFSITASAFGGGTIDPSGVVKVKEGEDQTFTVRPNEGFEVKDVKVNGESVGVVEEYTFQGTMTDGTIEAYFVEKDGVQADKTKLNDSIVAAEELLKHAEEYVKEDIDNLKIALENAKTVVEDTTANQETIDAAQKALDAAMNITPIENEFTIIAEATEGGVITPSGEVKVQKGADQIFEIHANDGYEISDVLVDDQSVGAVENYVFQDVNAQASIKAVFQKIVVSTDKTELNEVLEKADALLAQKDKYTEETIQILQKEVESAQLVASDNQSTQDEIDAAVSNVTKAMDSLKEKSENPDTNNPEKPDTNKPEKPDTSKPDVNKPNMNKTENGNNHGSSIQPTTQKPAVTNKREIAKTGDTTSVARTIVATLFAGGGAMLLTILKRRKDN